MSPTILDNVIRSKTLPVMESFDTLQGEGQFSGSAAYFIRLGGCDVGCHWCDVKESWDATLHPDKKVEEIFSSISSSSSRIVVITGGEPLMYDLDELTSGIQDLGKRTHVETSGVYPLSGNWHWICFSPKKFKPALSKWYEVADELKVVVYNKSDIEWAESHAHKMVKKENLFLQPEWSKRNQITPLIVDYVKENPKWRISLQTHKYLNIP